MICTRVWLPYMTLEGLPWFLHHWCELFPLIFILTQNELSLFIFFNCWSCFSHHTNTPDICNFDHKNILSLNHYITIDFHGGSSGFIRGPGDNPKPVAFSFHDKFKQGPLLSVVSPLNIGSHLFWEVSSVCMYGCYTYDPFACLISQCLNS